MGEKAPLCRRYGRLQAPAEPAEADCMRQQTLGPDQGGFRECFAGIYHIVRPLQPFMQGAHIGIAAVVSSLWFYRKTSGGFVKG